MRAGGGGEGREEITDPSHYMLGIPCLSTGVSCYYIM